MKTVWRVINSKGEVVFQGKSGYYQEADKYIKDHPEQKDLKLDPEMS